MPANTQPIWTLSPNIGAVTIPTTNAQIKSNGVSAGSGADTVYKCLTIGANGSYVDRIRFFSVSSANSVTGVATVLRAYWSTVASPGATTAADTFLIGEVNGPAQSSAHPTSPTNFVELVVEAAYPTGTYIHVSQAVAQTTNQNWIAIGFAGNY